MATVRTTSLPSNPLPPASMGTTADRVLATVAAVLVLAIYVVLRRELAAARRPLMAWLRDKTWNPYAAGALLGLVVAFSEVICGRPLAASGAFDKLAAYLGRALFPTSQYYGHIMIPGITWQVWLIVGVLAGSFASSKLSGEARLRWLPDTQWQPRFGGNRKVRLVIAFWGAVLAPAAFLFMAGMFASGIPTAWLWYRGRAD